MGGFAGNINARTDSISMDVELLPYEIAIDSNEGHPWTFAGFPSPRTDRDGSRIPFVVPTVRKALYQMSKRRYENRGGIFMAGLADYTIVGYEERIQIERKSIADLFSTVTSQRHRFEAELSRLSECEIAYVIVEGGWDSIAQWTGHGITPKAMIASIVAFEQRYPVRWVLPGGRAFAEMYAFLALKRFWDDDQDKEKVKRIKRVAK